MVTKLQFLKMCCLSVLLFLFITCQPANQPTAVPSPIPVTSTPAGEPLLRLTNGEWPPYLSETLPHYGLASRIVTEAFAVQGIKVEYGFFPWPRSLALAQDGSWAGSAVWFKNEEREKDFYYSDPIIEVQYVFFHLKTFSFDWQSYEDLAEVRIGATLEYDYGPAFTEAEQSGQIKVERVPADEQNFDKLLAGRIDIFPLDLEVGLNMLQKNFTSEQIALITYHPLPVRSDPGYLLLSKKVAGNEELIQVFNEGLQKLKESGQFEQFVQESRAGNK